MNNYLLLFSCTEDTILLPTVEVKLWRTNLKYTTRNVSPRARWRWLNAEEILIIKGRFQNWEDHHFVLSLSRTSTKNVDAIADLCSCFWFTTHCFPFMIHGLKMLASNNTCLIFKDWEREQQSKIPVNAWCPEFLTLKYIFSKGCFKKIFTFWLLWWSSFHSSL